MNNYTSESITILSGLEAVRRRPGMFIGSTDQRGLNQLVLELIDNAVDEALAGHATAINVRVCADGSCQVKDNGRGIPTTVHPDTGRPACEVVLTTLHAGGKFGDGAYKVSGGLHGVGLSCVNALSESLTLEVYREGTHYSQQFSRGKPIENLRVVGKSSHQSGTEIHFLPDARIFRNELDFDRQALTWRLRELSFLVPGLSLTMLDEIAGSEQCYEESGGLSVMVAEQAKGRRPLHSNPIQVQFLKDGSQVQAALQWTRLYAEMSYSYVNTIRTHHGGVHVDGFHQALLLTVQEYANSLGLAGEKIILQDVCEGLTAGISVMITEPEFEGQTKGRLANAGVHELVLQGTKEALRGYLVDHPEEAEAIVERVYEAVRARSASRDAQASSRLQTPPTIATPDVYRSQFGERSKNWHDSAVWITHDELLAAHGDFCVMPADSTCLDVCCGSGVVGNSFRNKVKRIIGLDITPEMVALSKTRLDDVILGTVYDIPFPDAQFEVVCNREVMHLMPQPERMMNEVFRVLKPGGQFVVGQIIPYSIDDAAWMFRIFKKKQPLLYHMFLDEDFEQLLTNSGLTDIQKKELLVWEDIDVWIDTIETSSWHRHEIRKLYNEAPEHIKAIHPFEILPSGKIMDCWRWIIYSGRKPM